MSVNLIFFDLSILIKRIPWRDQITKFLIYVTFSNLMSLSAPSVQISLSAPSSKMPLI
jgi:hypothetical protein